MRSGLVHGQTGAEAKPEAARPEWHRRTLPPIPTEDVMTEIQRAGARRCWPRCQAEVEKWLAQRAHLRDEQGRRQIGYLPEREITTGVGDADCILVTWSIIDQGKNAKAGGQGPKPGFCVSWLQAETGSPFSSTSSDST